jgi:DNA (cytosine-5)-methyltransferase 1
VAEPTGTFTTRDRFALLGGDVPAFEECSFRMLTPHEVANGMAFHPDYQVLGSARDRVAGFGNAVPPPMGEMVMSALVECASGEDLAVAA